MKYELSEKRIRLHTHTHSHTHRDREKAADKQNRKIIKYKSLKQIVFTSHLSIRYH